MDSKQKKICITIKIVMIICYIVLETLFLHGIYTRAGLDGTSISKELADRITIESTIENICEMCIYILFFVYSSYVWKWDNDKRYLKYTLNMCSIIFILFLLGCAFSAIQYLLMGTYWTSYFMPVIMLICFMVANLLLVSGKQAKKNIQKDK